MNPASSSPWKFSLFKMTGMIVLALFSMIVCSGPDRAAAEVPPAAVKKAVPLNKDRSDAAHVFSVSCGTCHTLPDPAKPAEAKPGCAKGISEGDRVLVKAHMTDVRTGKGLYESRCGRCHELIPPASHTPEYWSKNLCTSDECFIEKMNEEEEQQVLIYLQSQARGK